MTEFVQWFMVEATMWEVAKVFALVGIGCFVLVAFVTLWKLFD